MIYDYMKVKVGRARKIDNSSLDTLMYHDPSDNGSLILNRSIPKKIHPFKKQLK